jgi:hypothetical protein
MTANWHERPVRPRESRHEARVQELLPWWSSFPSDSNSKQQPSLLHGLHDRPHFHCRYLVRISSCHFAIEQTDSGNRNGGHAIHETQNENAQERPRLEQSCVEPPGTLCERKQLQATGFSLQWPLTCSLSFSKNGASNEIAA